ncbi:MAG: endolytic transglycosylase MltG [Alphaproteobacteria bacterium]
MKRVAVGSSLLAFFIGLSIFTWALVSFVKPGALEEPQEIYFEKGLSLYEIARILKSESVIDYPYIFTLWVRGTGNSLKAGEYRFIQGSSAMHVMRLMVKGKTLVRRITVPEGLSSKEVIKHLSGAKKLKEYEGQRPKEGALLPETYHYSYGDSANEIVSRMQFAMQRTLAELWVEREEKLLIKTPEEALTLASIVEKETALKDERQRVAGVFYNRLRKGMKLQTDPTVAYAIAQGVLDRPLTRHDIRTTKSPYNTYLNKGLPPTPIANPGKESIYAVLHPEKNNYIYFVANGRGGHAFAKTLKEHNRNVREWRRINKKRK